MDSLSAAPTASVAGIAARSERQAMDWSLVLASQEIEVTIAPPDERGVWWLLVPAADHGRALAAIHKFRAENRRWTWRHAFPDSELSFHWGALVWAFVLAFFHALPADLVTPFAFATRRVHAGEWWRAFTAVGLHADVGHLASNLVLGVIVLGLAMGRFGPGRALACTWLAGAAGNFFAMFLRDRDYVGVGASGMVMGAVGLLSAQAMEVWHDSRHATRYVLGTLFAGCFLFILTGTDMKGDVLAHAGGYATGVGLGGILSLWWRFRAIRRKTGVAR